jgi:broad specificity phosphatase PhoE
LFPCVVQTERGKAQAREAGQKIRRLMEAEGSPYNLFFYTSPYKRSKQTYEEVKRAFAPEQAVGMQEEVQLREQDFGNFQVRRRRGWVGSL